MTNSQTLLAGIEITRSAATYTFPATTNSSRRRAGTKNLVDESLDLAEMRPVFAVKKGNPLGLHNLDDLTRKGAKLAHANPDAGNTVGKLSRGSPAASSGAWDAFAKQVVVNKATVSDVANDIRVSAGGRRHHLGCDAALNIRTWRRCRCANWRASRRTSRPACCTVRSGRRRRCASPASSPPRSGGWGPASRRARLLHGRRDGDAWAETPELKVFAGAMLRPAVDQTITGFEEPRGRPRHGRL